MLDHYKNLRERYEFQMGPARGRMATALDILTDALTLVGTAWSVLPKFPPAAIPFHGRPSDSPANRRF